MNIISKFSLYDIIAMVIPGFTILLFITSILGYQWTINDGMVNSTIFWIVAATLSYCPLIPQHYNLIFFIST